VNDVFKELQELLWDEELDDEQLAQLKKDIGTINPNGVSPEGIYFSGFETLIVLSIKKGEIGDSMDSFQRIWI